MCLVTSEVDPKVFIFSSAPRGINPKREHQPATTMNVEITVDQAIAYSAILTMAVAPIWIGSHLSLKSKEVSVKNEKGELVRNEKGELVFRKEKVHILSQLCCYC